MSSNHLFVVGLSLAVTLLTLYLLFSYGSSSIKMCFNFGITYFSVRMCLALGTSYPLAGFFWQCLFFISLYLVIHSLMVKVHLLPKVEDDQSLSLPLRYLPFQIYTQLLALGVAYLSHYPLWPMVFFALLSLQISSHL